MCGDYWLINKQIKSDQYAMPITKEIFDVIRYATIFSTLDLRSRYHQLLVRNGNKHKIEFWRIDAFEQDKLY